VSGLLSRVSKHSDLLAALAVVVVVIMLIIPMPPQIIDLLIATNITVGLLLLLATMYVPRALDLAAFPSILLLTTMLRLAINVSVTRLILLHGHAGDMVTAFGNFVVGGSLIVGIVVFLLLVVIQFIVVTNGSGRVAEVAARFTLDAMPGKQMAIDADLNAGQITEDQARQRREEITREADFYGAMDGASKFVKGDAMASIIIVVINLVGGIAVGVLQQGRSFSDAIHTFSLLTIGDGLAAQIPALLISVATGILVTRAASTGDLGSDITSQVASHPKVLQIAGAVAIGFGLFPGMPKIPFLLLGAVLVFLGRTLAKRAPQEDTVQEAAPQLSAEQEESQRAQEVVAVNPLELALGINLIPLVDSAHGGTLLNRIRSIRNQIAEDLGVIIPQVRIHDEPSLETHEYVIMVRGSEVDRAHVVPGHLLAINSGQALGHVSGIDTTEPAFGLPAIWIDESLRTEAEGLSYTVVDAESVIITHLTEVIRRHVADLLSRQETRKLLDALKASSPAVVEDVVPDALSIGDVQRVLQALLREGVPIKDLATILETIGDRARAGDREPQLLAEYARRQLARMLVSPYLDESRTLRAINLTPQAEQELTGALTRHTPDGAEVLGIDPQRAQQIVAGIAQQADMASQMGLQAVLLTSAPIRRHLREMLSATSPSTPVFSYQEIPSGINVEFIGEIA